MRYIQQFLGHASLETTQRYLLLVPGYLKEDYDAAMPGLTTSANPSLSDGTVLPL
jgi:site-specific recombinase XerC